MNRIDELICEIEALALDYITTWGYNDGLEIRDAFEEYFDIISDSPYIDKRVVSSAWTIITTFRRNIDLMRQEILGKSQEMYEYLCMTIDNWKPELLGDMYDSGDILLKDEIYKILIEAGNPAI